MGFFVGFLGGYFVSHLSRRVNMYFRFFPQYIIFFFLLILNLFIF